LSFRTPHQPLPPSETVTTLDDGTVVRRRGPRMRACAQRDAKGKLCAGHLKRWFGAPAPVTARFGGELYRCERCKTIYLPFPGEARTAIVGW
jgi:hypothetical protein